MKSRDLSLDTIRVLACLLVVLMHSPMPSANANGPFLAMLSYFTAPCIGLFFMVSGALLLPVKMDYFTFLKRRLAKVVVPTLVWTAVYIGLNIYFSQSEINVLRAVASIPFSPQGHGVLWFMYTLIGLYLLAPILSGWLVSATGKELKFVLMLWGISLCYPLLKYGVDINSSTTGILYYFTGYAGYFLLGYALKEGRLRLPAAWPVLIAVSGVVLLLALKHYGIDYDFYSLFWYESIFIAALCCVYWQCVLWFIGKCSQVRSLQRVVDVSNASFGIYLVHILIMRYWLWHTGLISSISNYLLQTLAIATITLLLSFLFCSLISRLRLGQWIIGYTSKK